MLAIIAAAMVLTTVVGGLISAFSIEARHGLHDPTLDQSTPTRRPTPAWRQWS
ncbi:hypothetical protein Mesau_02754 [Mesorhizobium australicum WSM2073]|uniref:Uncharacterized protein n=1 Tax=Mesorhizobium australicum (strain HAMBI 3006 / LMG 24608 / WSM2073) TaxID=754035 RepID=L0KJG2_MESAW|nr:hypothetical protein Mesau_02754 [Mesorhizobium australicum WSM2073]